ncbi:MAG: BMP family ABC transporter substrate-binding protein, partial [Thermodesulfobacteriota bacterium]|nr:BMP family ABC transporter substrate-binding protein [Thermodesulfobacteriota bacterium]
MKKSFFLPAVFIFCLCGVSAWASEQEPETGLFYEAALFAQRELQVGFVHDSKVRDSGWSFAHDQARKAVSAMPGVTTYFTESVSPGRELEDALNDMGTQNFDIVFATGRGNGQEALKAATIFRDTVFVYRSFGKQCAVNAVPYAGRMYQARYLTGMVAGAMTHNNTLGYVAAYPTVEAIRGINAFALGAASVNPATQVRVAWTGTWYDPGEEEDAAYALMDLGADVIAQDQDSPAAQEAARERGVYSIGSHSDMSAFAPEAHLTAAIWNWAALYRKVVTQVREGRLQAEPVWWGLDRGLVDTAPFGPMVPGDVQDRTLSKKIELSSGKAKVFEGPVTDRDG